MNLLKKILIAIDFSDSTKNMMSMAIEMAKVFDSILIPIHILPKDIANKKAQILLNEAVTEKLAKITKSIRDQGVEVGDWIIEFGSAHEEIVNAATLIDANLILVGSGESLRGDQFQLGTTTSRIIQKSEKPVFVIKENTALNIQSILCPVDFSPTAKRALKNAITMAHRFKAELTILGVLESPNTNWFNFKQEKEDDAEKSVQNYQKKFDVFLEGFNLSGLNWKKAIRKGNPPDEILNTISEKMVDLLIIGSQGRTGLNRLLIGSVAEKVVREVPCSFVTLKSEEIITLQLDSRIRDIEDHYNMGIQLMEDGFYEEAIGQLKICLNINMMYLPAHFGLAKIYDKMNNPKKAEVYRKSGKEIMDKIWYAKIEDEVRKYRSY